MLVQEKRSNPNTLLKLYVAIAGDLKALQALDCLTPFTGNRVDR